jgi:hypothetical protein
MRPEMKADPPSRCFPEMSSLCCIILCKLMSMQHNNLNLTTVTKRNSNVALMFMYQYRLVSVFKDYFGELEERLLKPLNLHISHCLPAT